MEDGPTEKSQLKELKRKVKRLERENRALRQHVQRFGHKDLIDKCTNIPPEPSFPPFTYRPPPINLASLAPKKEDVREAIDRCYSKASAPELSPQTLSKEKYPNK